jgi:hypothetical protein
LKLVEIQKLASKGFAGGYGLGNYFDPETGIPTDYHSGDALEWFVAREIADTYDSEAPDKKQLKTAIGAINIARKDLQGAIDSLREGVKCNVKR